ncbi:MAG TPA: cysteine desulfurase family protein, partial [Spirochaetia bacterium]
MIYLDWAASAPPEPEALDEARSVALRWFANPSAPHAAGREAGEKLDAERSRLARLLAVEPREIFYTSGGTESNTSLLLSTLDRHRLGGVERQKTRILTTEIEHASVYEQVKSLQGHGIASTVVKPRADGTVDPQAIADALDDDTVLVSVMLVNNETGAIQDIAEISRAVREFSGHKGRKILLHTDAVQALGKIPLSLKEWDVDAASFSGHKIGAPRGVGALYLRGGSAPGFIAVGGGQESGRRPGTENLAGIAALGVALEGRLRRLEENLAAARENERRLIDGIRAINGGWIFPMARGAAGTSDRYSPWIVSLGFPPLPAEVVVRTAESAGFLVATGSACSSKKKDRTRVPLAMG